MFGPINEPLDPPIFLVGAPRSGTTWLGEAFAESREIAYWPEPRHVWVWGNWRRPHDELTAADAKPCIQRHIRRRFAKFVRQRGARRLCEKTPGNCLRLQLVQAVYPDAKYVLLLRDGRAIYRSIAEILRQGVKLDVYANHLRTYSLADLPDIVLRIPRVVRAMLGRPLRFWGPRPLAWKKWLSEESPEVTIAKQWSYLMNRALDDLARVDAANVLTVRYEEMVEEPRAVMSNILSFLELTETEPVLSFVEKAAQPGRAQKWRAELDAGLLERIKPHLIDTLERMEYEW